jgi:tetratricopeptide (TPR) repeat protein
MERDTMDIESELEKVRYYINSGKYREARNILRNIIINDRQNEIAWMLFSYTAENNKHRLQCLENVLKINPNNQDAIQQKLKVLEEIINEKDSNKSQNHIIILFGSIIIISCLFTIMIGILLGGLLIMKPKLFATSNTAINATNSNNLINPTIIPPTAIIIPTETKPNNTPIPELLPGPARRYVPSSNDQMPSIFDGSDIEDYTLDDGNYFYIQFETMENENSFYVNMDEPSIRFWSYVGRTIDQGKQKYSDQSQQFQIDSQNAHYVWSKSTYNSKYFTESGQFIEYENSEIFGDVGRVIRNTNVVVIVIVKIRNMNGINKNDINGINNILDTYTAEVESRMK